MNQPLPSWAANFVGIPYKPLGRDRSGADCWGLLLIVMREQFATHVPEFHGIGFDEGCDRKKLTEFMQAHNDSWLRIPTEEARAGDGVLLRALGAPIHVGVVITPGFMVHSERGSDSCVESYLSSRWRTRLEGVYRYVG